jgi:PAS domain S-box-containing protein
VINQPRGNSGASSRQHLSGRERTFGEDEIIVTKTDPKGRITYANDVFLRVAGYTEAEVLGKAHNLVRHPEMPRCVFKYLWDTIASGEEVFAYVLNRARNGDHYWVFAHVTPTFDQHNRIVAYHSNRRSPSREAVGMIQTDQVRVIDASTAFRTAPGWTYGFPELTPAQEASVRGARRVSGSGATAPW